MDLAIAIMIMDKITAPSRHIIGFTLIEVLITISLAAIILSIGVPSFRQLIESNKLHTTRDLLVSSISLAQQQAMTKNIAVFLCPTTDGTSCEGNWPNSTGWLVYENSDRTVGLGTGDLIVAKELNIKIQKITTKNLETRFSSTGNVSVNQFTLCSNITSQNDDRISINRSGRITYEASGAYCTP